MEDLNKNQMILLVLLVSFVTSIGTGIITVALLEQAPLEVTSTINHVIEKTIETVTPASVSPTTSKPQQVTTTVVVKEDDQVVNAIAKNTKSIVRIREKNASLGVDNFYALGVVVSTSGIIATDKKTVSEAMDYTALLSDGTVIPLVSVFADRKSEVGFFQAKAQKGYLFSAVSFAPTVPALGQSIVVIGGETTNTVSVGRITMLNTKDTGTTTPPTIVSLVSDTGPIGTGSGAPAFSLSGDLLGLTLSSFSSSKIYIPSSEVKRQMLLLVAPKNSM